MHVERASRPPIEGLTSDLENIYELVRNKLDSFDEIEKNKKMSAIESNVERLFMEAEVDVQEIVMLESQLEELPGDDESVQALTKRVHDLRTRNEERNVMKGEIEGKLAEVMNCMNLLHSKLSPIVEEEKGATTGQLAVDEEITTLEAGINEAMSDILVPLNDLASQAEHENIAIPAIQAELENVHSFVDKCKVS